MRRVLETSPWLVLAPIIALCCALPAVGHGFAWAPSSGQTFYLTSKLVGSAGVLLGLLVWRPRGGLPWILLGAGVLCDAIGGLLISIPMIQGQPSPPSPYWSDLFFLPVYPLWTAALIILLGRREPLRQALTELAIIGFSIGIAAGVLIAAPYFLSHDFGRPELIQASYAAADVPLLACVIRLLISSGPRNASVRLAGLAAFAYVASDALWNWTILGGVQPGSNGWFDAGWLISDGLFAAALLHPSMRAAATSTPAEGRRLRVSKAYLVGAAPLVGPLVLGLQHYVSDLRIEEHMALVGVVLAGSGAIAALVTWRFWLVMRSDVETQAAALVDPLTGLLNRTALASRVAELTHQSQTAGDPVGVLVGDVDHFKAVNDTWGHATGDDVLRHVATALRGGMRAFDLVYRLGGEEFLVLLPGADAAHTQRVAERLRRAVRTETADEGHPVTISFGFSVSPRAAIFDFDALFAAADAALYQAKRSGRDCVRPVAPSTLTAVA